MKIVAFMQNMWVRNPERVKAMIAEDGEELRLRLIEYSLFAGCVSGRRLKAAFGADVCEQIVWEESTREIAGDPKTIFEAQPEHIQAVLELHKPDVVITFGRIAEHAVGRIWQGRIICAPHPAARQPDTTEKLKRAAVELQALRMIADGVSPCKIATETGQYRWQVAKITG